MKNTLLIVNPNAGQMKSKNALFSIVSTLSSCDMLTTVYVTKARGDATEFVTRNANKYDAVVCCGGDGTLNETVNGVIKNGCNIPVGYIPAGSTNDFASSLEISPNPELAAKSIGLGRERNIDVGCFNNQNHFTYVASFGAFTKASYNTPQHIKNALGHAAYIFEGAKMISEIKPFKLKCRCNDEVIEGKFLFGAIINSTSIGGIKLLEKECVKFDDGMFELLLVRFPENLTQTTETFNDFVLRNFGTKNIILTRGSRFALEFEHPIDFSLDGEYGNEHSVANIDVKRNAIKLLNRTI